MLSEKIEDIKRSSEYMLALLKESGEKIHPDLRKAYEAWIELDSIGIKQRKLAEPLMDALKEAVKQAVIYELQKSKNLEATRILGLDQEPSIDHVATLIAKKSVESLKDYQLNLIM